MNIPTVFEAACFTVHLAGTEQSFAVRADQTVLQGALAANTALPSSCRNGTCRTCLSQLVSGQVGYRIDWPGLSAEEKRDGYFLPCVAYPKRDLAMVPPAGLCA